VAWGGWGVGEKTGLLQMARGKRALTFVSCLDAASLSVGGHPRRSRKKKKKTADSLRRECGAFRGQHMVVSGGRPWRLRPAFCRWCNSFACLFSRRVAEKTSLISNKTQTPMSVVKKNNHSNPRRFAGSDSWAGGPALRISSGENETCTFRDRFFGCPADRLFRSRAANSPCRARRGPRAAIPLRDGGRSKANAGEHETIFDRQCACSI